MKFTRSMLSVAIGVSAIGSPAYYPQLRILLWRRIVVTSTAGQYSRTFRCL